MMKGMTNYKIISMYVAVNKFFSNNPGYLYDDTTNISSILILVNSIFLFYLQINLQ